MESERRPPDIGESAILAGQAHRRIDLLLDRVKELTEERDAARREAIEDHAPCREKERELTAARDAARRQHVAWIDALRAGDNADVRDATHRALDEVISALDGWIEGAKSNHEALGHRGEPVDSECWRVFHVDDIRNMVEDARRQLGAERDFDAVVDHCDGCATVRAERDDAIERAEQFERERDEARAALNRQAAATEQVIRERDEVQERCLAHRGLVDENARLHRELDQAQAKAERAEALMNSAHESHNKVLLWSHKAQAERDTANAMVANLRSVLSSIVESIDNQEPK